MTQKILRLPEVKKRTGLSRSSIYLKASQGSFPKPYKISERAVGWLQSDIDDWLSNCIKSSQARKDLELKGEK